MNPFSLLKYLDLLKKNPIFFIFTIIFFSANTFLFAQANDVFIININTPDYGMIVNDITHSITYKSAFSKSLQKAWFFTRQHINKSRLVVVNTATNNASTITMNKPVGDVIFNPYKNQFIVIENKNSTTNFKVYNGFTNALVAEYPTGLSNCEKMFIDPNGNLYITGNMIPNGNTIFVKVYSATDYSFIQTISFNYTSQQNEGYVKADFDYNYHNQSVYGVFRTFYAGFSPLAQQPQNNSDGVLIKISNNFTVTTFTNGIDSPEKIICDNDIYTVSSYNIDASKLGKCYIKMGGSLKVFDCNNETITSVNSCNDYTYSPLTNTIYLTNGATYGHVYAVAEDGTQTLLYSSSNLSSCRSINLNPYNGRLYFYVVKNDVSPQTMLYSLNPDDIAPELKSTYLHNKSLDILGDNDFYFSSQPVFAPVTNHLLIPNGTHGNISVVEFEANEPLLLDYGTDWISIPRTKGNGTGNGNSSTEGDFWYTTEVLHQNNFKTPYQKLASYHFDAKLQDANAQPYKATFNIENAGDWSFESDLYNTYSTRGYKLDVTPDGFNILYMQGKVADPLQTIPLYADKENWIGYWLYQTQSPFDAIAPGVLNQLTEMKAKEWYCFKDWYMGQQNPQWICGVNIGKGGPHLSYGDMVILKPGSDVNSFQWQNGNPFGSFALKLPAEYYEFNEKEDYTAYLVEVDTANRPTEIGAFIGSTCVGASKVLPEDTLVLIRGYDKDTTGTIYFVEYFNGQKSGKPAITNYFVKNRFNNGWQKRVIKTAERESHYLISFKAKKIIKQDDESTDEDPLFRVYPNPATSSLTIQYEIIEKSSVIISIYDITGRKLMENNREEQPTGVYQTGLNIKNLKNGIYLLRLSTGNQTVVKRFVVDQ
ncbi:MAG: hypothetical protein DRJ09_04300 [Bacteroidetes bacterium]|nr:MAG: hypothetical protein DRJ09_04300 [Bacteroidota bacterium]